MGKLVRTIAIIIIAFTLASLFLYRLRLGHGTGRGNQPRAPANALIQAEGQVSEVDEDEGRLVLKSGDQSIIFRFDSLTSITDAGENVSPSAITPGAVATVLYIRRNGRNRARAITLTHRAPAMNWKDPERPSNVSSLESPNQVSGPPLMYPRRLLGEPGLETLSNCAIPSDI